MSRERRVEFVVPYFVFQGSEPFDEALLCLGREVKSQRIERGEFGQFRKDPRHASLSFRVWLTIRVLPVWLRVRPHHDLKTLEESVVAWAVLESLHQIGTKSGGLDSTQHGKATGFNKNRASS